MGKKKVGNGAGGSIPTNNAATINLGFQKIPEQALNELKGTYSQFQNYFPLIEKFTGEKIIENTNIGLKASLDFPENTDDVFVKVVHLLNPEDWVQGCYTFTKDIAIPGLVSGWEAIVEKLQDQDNQAYVDTLTVSLLSQLREKGLSPHFVKYYGALVAKADKYCYNISEDFESYKATKWFWKNMSNNSFGFRVFSNTKKRFLNTDEIKEFMLTPEQVELLKDEEEASSHGDIEITVDNTITIDNTDAESIHSVRFDFSDASDVQGILRISPSNRTTMSGSDDENEDDENDFFVEFQNMPVMLVFMEKLKGVMDSLVDEPYNEERWTAWICQVIFALTQAQAFIELYHNDLHGNNILFSETDQEYLYYRTKDGQIWRLPTFGKIFYLIDFGRAILRVQNQLVISDDFAEGNDAAGQYNFGPIRDPKEAAVPPNASFDLVRLAVSIFESLFPEVPAEKTVSSGTVTILSKEGSKVQKETVSPLFNLLWSWLIDIKGKNILHSEDGEERFPGFDLYKHIAVNCKGAVPKDQIRKPIFECFKYKGVVPEGNQVYPLFV